jgi:predicted metalloendopeptidase
MKDITHRKKHRKKDNTTRRKNVIQKNLQRNNFYLWANYKWIKDVPKTLPKELRYIRPLDNFKLIQDEMYKNVLSMYHDYTKQHGKHNEKAHQMHNLYTSFLHLDKEPILGHVADFCENYNNFVQENDLLRFLGFINQNEMIKWASPIVLNVYPDEYTPNKLSPHISSPSLSLYDYRFYLSDDVIVTQMSGVKLNVSSSEHIDDNVYMNNDNGGPETKTIEYIKYKQKITCAFLKFIDAVFTKCLGAEYETIHNIKAQDVFDIECELMMKMNNIDLRFDQNYANIYSSAKHPEVRPDKVKLQKGTRSSSSATRNHYRHHIRGATRVYTDNSIELTDINWPEFAKQIGYEPDHIPSYFIAHQIGYLKTAMCTLKKEWASDRWKSYWFFIYMRQVICFHDKWREIYLEFNDTLIRGKDTHFPREYLPILGLAYAFPKTMTEEFIKRYKNEDMISKVREIGTTILECYKTRIERNTWMSDYTKKGAIKKLNTIKLNIGEPNLSAPDPTTLDYDPKDAWGNLLKRSIQRFRYIIRHSLSASHPGLTNEDIDIMNWSSMKTSGFQSYIVNAYYTPQTNSIYIPTAYMHSLNVQFGRGYEYDLASVGFTFGHEISHALHVQSRVYDHTGIIKNWWTRNDVAVYERKIASIRRQYEETSKKYGFVIDGNLSLSENLADITGLAVCEDALRAFHQRIHNDTQLSESSESPKHKYASASSSSLASSAMMTDQMRNLSFQHFYTYYAIQNRQYANRREMLVQVITNPHLDSKIRTNMPLKRSKTFREVFEIRKGDKMYSDEFDVVF